MHVRPQAHGWILELDPLVRRRGCLELCLGIAPVWSPGLVARPALAASGERTGTAVPVRLMS